MRPARLPGLAALALAALAAAAAPARASGPEDPAAADTSVHRFLDRLSDSTNVYFGMSATPLDTTGLDSLEANVFEGGRRFSFGILPSFDFHRTDGSTFGGALRLGHAGHADRLKLDAAYAVGSKDWLGGAEYRRSVRRSDARRTLEAWGGRETAPMNRDYHEPFLDPARALVTGSDRTNVVRHDGWRVEFERESDDCRAGLGFRDVLESPLATRATWDLFNRDLIVTPNLPAGYGRARELELDAGARLPIVPLRVEATYWTAGPTLKSDFAHDRLRFAAGGDISIGRWASLVPQFAWGFLNGEATPQETFYLGAGPTLVSVPRDALGGTSFAIARLQLIAAGDLLSMLHLPRPEALSFQPGLFAATGAVGGADPYGGPARRGERWPEAENWLSEAGISLTYTPGLPGMTVQLSEAWPLGPTSRKERFEFVITHPLDLLRRQIPEE